jgi:hypothetical protein
VSLGKYVLLVLGVAVATLTLAWPLVLGGLGSPAHRAVALGVVIALANTTAAHALVRWSSRRPTGVFLKAVLGGTVARLAFMILALLAGILLLDLPRLPLAVSLLSYFALFLALELAILHRRPLVATEAGR